MILESSCITEDMIDHEGRTVRCVTTNVKYIKGYPVARIMETLNVDPPQGFIQFRGSLWMRPRIAYDELNKVILYREIEWLLAPK